MDNVVCEMPQIDSTPNAEFAPRIRVLCVDDNPEMLRALSAVLSRSPALESIGGLTSVKQLSAEVDSLHPDVLLLDYSMPGESTLKALQDVKRAHPTMACIVFSGYNDPDVIDAAEQAGASRCLCKDVDIKKLVAAIIEVKRAMTV